ncbi:MAG: hypothetical protein HC875_36875, partial [Anaerolineales bacterium]|nr:hypothetical protein [Anaerolineales bacterium]
RPQTVTVNPTVSPASHVNGIYVEPTETELAAWQSYHTLHATARAALPAGSRDASSDTPPLLSSGSDLPPLLPRLVNSQRLIIAGGSDSGKTTVVKHLIAARPNHQTIIIDPHSPSKILGIDTIGAGRDYGAIANALEALVLLMSDRYQDVKHGLFGYGQHQPVAVFVDEWTSIGREVERAGEMLAVLLTESRKVNIFLTVIAHSLTNDILRVDNQIKRSAVQVELFGGNGEPHRAFIHPNTTIGPDGRKATPQEFALPGPFVEPARPATLVRYLPDPKIIRAQ